MATLQQPALAGEANTKGGSDDSTRIQAHIYSPAAKASTDLDFAQHLERCIDASTRGQGSKANRAGALSYLQSLSATRRQLLELLARPNSDADGDIASSLSQYVGLLLGLINTNGALSGQIAGDHCARRSVPFQWRDVLLQIAGNGMPDAVYELGSVLVAAAAWRQQRAAALCSGSSDGMPPETAISAYKLLQGAAGMYEFVQGTCAPLLAGVCPPPDMHPLGLKAARCIALADAQAITVLRAIQKGNAPSLVSGLAADTSQLYAEGATAVQQASQGMPAPKAALYAQWKAAAFSAYLHAFAGQLLLEQSQAGKGGRCCQESQQQMATAARSAAEFDRAVPRSTAITHQPFDAEMQSRVMGISNKVERERSTIYYQHVATEMPELPPTKRIAVAAAWSLPLPASEVAEGAASCFEVNRVQKAQAEAREAAAHPVEALLPPASEQPAQEKDGKGVKNGNAEKHQESSPACWRWLLVIVAMPFLVLISVVGLIVWLLLLPVKCFCCPCGCAIQLIYNAFEWLLKAPFRALLWASGKPWKPKAPSKEDNGQTHIENV